MCNAMHILLLSTLQWAFPRRHDRVMHNMYRLIVCCIQKVLQCTWVVFVISPVTPYIFTGTGTNHMQVNSIVHRSYLASNPLSFVMYGVKTCAMPYTTFINTTKGFP